MKLFRIIPLIFSLLWLSVLGCGCTRNEGNIGPLFGQWHLEEITIDGKEDAQYEHNLFWSFQSDIVHIQEVSVDLPDEAPAGCWGTFRDAGSVLYLDFSHYDDEHPQGSSPYAPLSATHLPVGANIPLTIETLGGNTLNLSYHDTENNILYGYRFRKY